MLACLAAPQLYGLLRFEPPGLDFLPLWTAGHMVWSEPGKIYDFVAVTRAQDWLIPPMRWLRPFAYPPTNLLLLAPLGRLAYWPALGLWTALNLGVFFYASARLAERSRTLVFALMATAPAVVLAVFAGQGALLVAGLTILAALELKGRPRLAGALFAIAAVLKPQALLLAPVALLACGAFEALASAVVVGAVLIGLSAALFGPARWTEWLAALAPFQAVVDGVPALKANLITPLGLADDLGLTGAASLAWRAAFALAGVALVWRAWSRPMDSARRLAVLLAGGLLVAPYALVYDAAILAPAAAVMAVGALAASDRTLRLVALAAISAVATPYLGAAAVLAFVVLASLDAPAPRVSAVASASS